MIDDTKKLTYAFRARLGTGGIVKILLSKKDDRLADAPTDEDFMNRFKDEGLMPVDTFDDDIIPQKKAGLINFYDTGQILVDGVWTDLDWQKIPAWSGTLKPVVDDLTLTDWQSMIAKIMTVSFADFPTKYRRIGYTEAHRYGIYVVKGTEFIPLETTEPRWTSEGLKVDGLTSGNFGILTGTAFNTFNNLAIPVGTKLTSVFNYSAPSVALNFDKATDVFLVPLVINESATGRIRFDGTITGYLNYIYRAVSREFFYDNPLLNADAFISPYLSKRSLNGVPTPNTATIFSDLMTLLKGRTGARQFIPGTGPTSAASFPNGDDIFYNGDPEALTDTSSKAVVHEGSLVAFIRQGNNWYYLWQTQTYTQGTGSFGESFFIELFSF